MYRNPLWLIFLGIIGLATFGYTLSTLIKIYNYYRLDSVMPTQTMQWSVDPINEEDFAVKAEYSYFFDGSLYEGSNLWDEHYLNALTAEEKISRLTKTFRTIWVDSDSPTYSALQKNFPFQQTISTIFLWTISVYFFWLGHYVKSYMQANKIR